MKAHFRNADDNHTETFEAPEFYIVDDKLYAASDKSDRYDTFVAKFADGLMHTDTGTYDELSFL